ncbi:recombinase family protein [Microbacterium sp. AK031]|uniref:recombinase family protein n=1 Tax=Microbacterium sp. AK031 TaxID=2723076 RepID=UPI0021688735|nr:recombinase family protein [Microbacterium sp. AK031]MCS3844796.1 DNA invertase Pin-like site-specific DNA recombinase [Microbacterium sp. AK031]
MDPIPAASYARISEKVAARDKVADQHAQNESHAAARGYRIVARYTDDGISALGHKERPDFERMLADAEAGAFAVIVATEEERLARNVEEKLELHTACEVAGVVWDTARDGYVDPATDSGEFMSTVRAAMGRIESKRKARRQRDASDERAADGLPTARPGYGYRREGSRDVIVEAEAVVIREAARRVLDGNSLRGIATDFNARGIPSPRTAELVHKAHREKTEYPTPIPWQGITLRQLIRRPSLAGLRTHRGKVVGNFDPKAHPAILNEDVHTRLEALLTDPSRAQGTGGRTPVHLLSGLAVCGRCGGRIKRLPGWTPKPGQKSKPVKAAYACGDCHKVRRIQEPVDQFVTEVILRRLEQPDAGQLFSQGDEGAAQEARNAIEVIDARLATAADQFAEGVLTGDQLRRITERLRADRTAHERTVSESMPARVPVNVVGPQARQTWAALHIDSQRAIIDTLAEVVIDPQGSGKPFDPDLIRIVWRA